MTVLISLFFQYFSELLVFSEFSVFQLMQGLESSVLPVLLPVCVVLGTLKLPRT